MILPFRISITNNTSPVLRGPVADDGFADDAVFGDGTKNARIAAVVAVIAHQEVLTRADFPCAVLTGSAGTQFFDVRLVHELPIDIELPLAERDRFAGHPDQSFDEQGVLRLFIITRGVKYDNITPMGAVDEIVYTADDQVLIVMKTRLHTGTFDEEAHTR